MAREVFNDSRLAANKMVRREVPRLATHGWQFCSTDTGQVRSANALAGELVRNMQRSVKKRLQLSDLVCWFAGVDV